VSSALRLPIFASVLGPAMVILAIGGIGAFVGGYYQYLLALLVVSCLVGVSLVMIVGYLRVIMLATGAMMGVGAYGAAILMHSTGFSYLETLPVVIVFGMIAGVVLAFPCTRFRGHHLAMVTILFQFLVMTVIREWSDLTGGPAGFRVPRIEIFGHPSSSDGAALLLITLLGAIATAILGAFLSGRFGKSLRAISSSEVAAQAFGINIARFHVAAFAISSGALAFAGALMAPRMRILDPDSFDLTQSIVALGYPIVGGMTSVWGGLIGGAALLLLPEMLRSWGQYQEFIVAAFVVLVMIAFPRGIMGLLHSDRRDVEAETLSPARPAFAQPVTPVVSAPSETATHGSHVAVVIDNVSKRYDALVAVDNVTINVERGAIHGLIGPNGAGKTTLFNVVSGFIRPDTGRVSIFENRVDNLPVRSRVVLGVTRTFQQTAVFGDLSCLDNVVLGRGKNGVLHSLGASLPDVFNTVGARKMKVEARAALVDVGIDHLRDERASRLSLGDQRRLEIARALVSQPKLILLDEPVSGVARDEEASIADLLRRLNAERGVTMLLIEHNIGFVRNLCRTLSVMAAGRIIAEGVTEQVIKLPEVRREYFGEVTANAA
jgi:branched-chain amino acid transport system permease protein